MSTGGRSYEESPETADEKSYSRSKLKDQVEKVAKSHEGDLPPDDKVSGDKISYGKKFSQTEELYAAHQMNRELEELARHDGMLEDAKGKKAEEDKAATKKPAKAEASKEATGPGITDKDKKGARRVDELTRGTPIGALPTSSEPPPRDRMSEVLDDAQRYTGMMRGAVKDFTTATFRLMRLPVELAILAAQRINPLKS